MNSTNDPNEDELRDRLRTLGRDAEQRAPAFQGMWRHAQRALTGRENARRPAWPEWMPAAAAAAVCLVAVLWMNHPRQKEHVSTPYLASNPAVEPATDNIPDDATPTDFLLTAADDSRELSVEQLTREIDTLLKP